jgi:hypothetical protein
LLAACGSSPAEQARKIKETEESWQATVRLTAELRGRYAVPEVYARQTRDAAEAELAKAHKKRQQLGQ